MRSLQHRGQQSQEVRGSDLSLDIIKDPLHLDIGQTHDPGNLGGGHIVFLCQPEMVQGRDTAAGRRIPPGFAARCRYRSSADALDPFGNTKMFGQADKSGI